MFRVLVVVVVKISDFRLLYSRSNTKAQNFVNTFDDIVQHSMTLRNSSGHYAMYLGIAQNLKSNFVKDLITKIYSAIHGPLSIKEGLPTFVYKSKNADRQDWYIFGLIMVYGQWSHNEVPKSLILILMGGSLSFN